MCAIICSRKNIMSKPGERIWPEEGKQPTWDLVIEDETFTLTWANTWMRFHRTGDPEFDEGLETFDHVLHNCGVDEKGYDAHGNCIVQIDPRYFRPTEVETLLGDATKAREKLGWTPKTTFVELVAEMVREDLKAAERDELVKKHGFKAFDRNE